MTHTRKRLAVLHQGSAINETEVEKALAAIVGNRRKAKSLLAQTTLRHLADARPDELEQFMSREEAHRLHAALSLGRFVLSPATPQTLDGPDAAYAHLFPYLTGRETERFVAVACDVRQQVLVTTVVSEGSPMSVEVRPADVFAPAVRHRAVMIVCAHNHPSNCATPSAEDYELTNRLLEAGRVLGIHLVDHLVIAGTSFQSLVHKSATTNRAASSRTTY